MRPLDTRMVCDTMSFESSICALVTVSYSLQITWRLYHTVSREHMLGRGVEKLVVLDGGWRPEESKP